MAEGAAAVLKLIVRCPIMDSAFDCLGWRSSVGRASDL